MTISLYTVYLSLCNKNQLIEFNCTATSAAQRATWEPNRISTSVKKKIYTGVIKENENEAQCVIIIEPPS